MDELEKGIRPSQIEHEEQRAALKLRGEEELAKADSMAKKNTCTDELKKSIATLENGLKAKERLLDDVRGASLAVREERRFFAKKNKDLERYEKLYVKASDEIKSLKSQLSRAKSRCNDMEVDVKNLKDAVRSQVAHNAAAFARMQSARATLAEIKINKVQVAREKNRMADTLKELGNLKV